MKHLHSGRKFSRHSSARYAMLRALATSLFLHGRIKTTLAKAKDIRPIVEKLVTMAKPRDGESESSLHTIRKLSAFLYTKEAVDAALKSGKTFKTRNGGYLRILKNNFRNGDSAPAAIIEFVETVS